MDEPETKLMFISVKILIFIYYILYSTIFIIVNTFNNNNTHVSWDEFIYQNRFELIKTIKIYFTGKNYLICKK